MNTNPKQGKTNGKRKSPPSFWRSKRGQEILAAKRATADWSRLSLWD
jgi:hypothetical protein